MPATTYFQLETTDASARSWLDAHPSADSRVINGEQWGELLDS